MGTAIVSDTTDDVWFLNEPISEQFGVGIKVEATDTEQTSEEVGKVRDKMVCCGNISHWLYLYVHGIICVALVTWPILYTSLYNNDSRNHPSFAF